MSNASEAISCLSICLIIVGWPWIIQSIESSVLSVSITTVPYLHQFRDDARGHILDIIQRTLPISLVHRFVVLAMKTELGVLDEFGYLRFYTGDIVGLFLKISAPVFGW